MPTAEEKRELARAFKRSERWEQLINEQKKDAKAADSLKPTERITFGFYLQQREAYLEFNKELPPAASE